jgi:hypothetical protein
LLGSISEVFHRHHDIAIFRVEHVGMMGNFGLNVLANLNFAEVAEKRPGR